ncbi:MAG: hypothetical protein KKB03_00170 [Nanoarchaeota archaeon]|nr:hypothetical protein [Nanoarchaeota archaeon]MBU1135793.1 hypothetical protein [Nanoarchaeota archaeon]MBU2519643.1 hypothetical protein [Nanoarchaeota archaeon]
MNRNDVSINHFADEEWVRNRIGEYEDGGIIQEFSSYLDFMYLQQRYLMLIPNHSVSILNDYSPFIHNEDPHGNVLKYPRKYNDGLIINPVHILEWINGSIDMFKGGPNLKKKEGYISLFNELKRLHLSDSSDRYKRPIDVSILLAVESAEYEDVKDYKIDVDEKANKKPKKKLKALFYPHEENKPKPLGLVIDVDQIGINCFFDENIFSGFVYAGPLVKEFYKAIEREIKEIEGTNAGDVVIENDDEASTDPLVDIKIASF